MKIAVVTDSGTGWTQAQAEALGIHYLPLQVKCGDDEFLDGIDITVSQLYARLKQGARPTTSMPPVGRVESLFETLKQEQVEHVIAVPLSAGISSTSEMIQAAARRAELPLTVIDPYTTVNTQGYLALSALKLAERGVEPAEIERRLKECVDHSNTLLVPDDLQRVAACLRSSRCCSFTNRRREEWMCWIRSVRCVVPSVVWPMWQKVMALILKLMK